MSANERLEIRLSSDEKEELKQNAQEAGQTLTQYILDSALNHSAPTLHTQGILIYNVLNSVMNILNETPKITNATKMRIREELNNYVKH